MQPFSSFLRDVLKQFRCHSQAYQHNSKWVFFVNFGETPKWQSSAVNASFVNPHNP
jgi:predicted CxxxxCH...CXXCH cytochrome family protein